MIIVIHKILYYYTKIHKFTAETFVSRLPQANLASKTSNISALVKKTDFDDKLKNLHKKVTSNKAKHIEAEIKIIDSTIKVI